MKTSLLLRVAAGISLLFVAGHSAGGLKLWSPMGPNSVLNAMTATHFQTMGANRSYLDFYLGFGWSLTIAGLLQTVLLWQLANMARAHGAVSVRPMIGTFAAATLASAVVAWVYIFPMVAMFCLVMLIPLVLAYLARE